MTRSWTPHERSRNKILLLSILAFVSLLIVFMMVRNWGDEAGDPLSNSAPETEKTETRAPRRVSSEQPTKIGGRPPSTSFLDFLVMPLHRRSNLRIETIRREYHDTSQGRGFELNESVQLSDQHSSLVAAKSKAGFHWFVLSSEDPVLRTIPALFVAKGVTLRLRGGESEDFAGADIVAFPWLPFSPVHTNGIFNVMQAQSKSRPLIGDVLRRFRKSGLWRFPNLPRRIVGESGEVDSVESLWVRVKFADNSVFHSIAHKVKDGLYEFSFDPQSMCVIEGHVADTLGAAMIGASITIQGRSSAQCRSDRWGNYKARIQESQGLVVIRAQALGFADEAIRLRPKDNRRRIRCDLVLERDVVMRGVVVDQDGLGIAGARVEIQRRDREPMSSTTDSAGLFVFRKASEGKWATGVSPPRDGDEFLVPGSTLFEGEDPNIRIEIKRIKESPRTLLVNVIDGQTGHPIAKGKVSCAMKGRGRRRVHSFDLKGGLARCELAVPGKWNIDIKTAFGKTVRTVEFIGEVGTKEITVKVGPTCVVRGRVFCESPADLPTHLIIINSPSGVGHSIIGQNSMPGCAVVPRGEEMQFAYDGVTGGIQLSMRVAAGSWLGETTITTPFGGECVVEIKMAKGTVVTVFVQDMDRLDKKSCTIEIREQGEWIPRFWFRPNKKSNRFTFVTIEKVVHWRAWIDNPRLLSRVLIAEGDTRPNRAGEATITLN